MSPEETAFITGVAELANRIGITPDESVCLFGVLAASLANSDMKHNGTSREAATARAGALFNESLQRAMATIMKRTLQ